MTEYIERDALMVALCKEITGEGDYYNGKDDMQDQIRDMVSQFPAADVAPVVHGQWDDSGRYTFPGGSTAVRCINCGCALTESEYRLNNWNYCPVCGAKMDGGTDHEAN